MKKMQSTILVFAMILFSQSVYSDVRSRDNKLSHGQHFIKGIGNICYKMNSKVTTLDTENKSIDNSEQSLKLESELLNALSPEMSKYGMEITGCNDKKTTSSNMAILGVNVVVKETTSKPFNFQYTVALKLSEVARNKKSDQMSRVHLLVTDYIGHKESLQEALSEVVIKAAEHVLWSSDEFHKARAN